ncbi:unannotated protein [freshwater metagenome]|uniref:Unannotated protein n=1 Tax=freshwater metagenome TaxID=449393 RepID=A0A6J6ZV83_9ZZZZ
MGVGHDLESKGREGLLVIGLTLNDDLAVTRLGSGNRGDIKWAWKVCNDRIEHGLNTLVLKRRPGQNGGELVSQSRATDSGL